VIIKSARRRKVRVFQKAGRKKATDFMEKIFHFHAFFLSHILKARPKTFESDDKNSSNHEFSKREIYQLNLN
jgi:hypothetical protein